MCEQWKPIQDRPDYEVSSLGKVRNTKTGTILKQFPNRAGYMRLQLGDRKNHSVHILVAQAFIPNPENKPEVNHKHGKKSDNRASQLGWSAHKENLVHPHTLRRKHPRRRPVLAISLETGARHIFPTIAATVALGCATNAPSVHACVWQKCKSHNGFAFQFLN